MYSLKTDAVDAYVCGFHVHTNAPLHMVDDRPAYIVQDVSGLKNPIGQDAQFRGVTLICWKGIVICAYLSGHIG